MSVDNDSLSENKRRKQKSVCLLVYFVCVCHAHSGFFFWRPRNPDLQRWLLATQKPKDFVKKVLCIREKSNPRQIRALHRVRGVVLGRKKKQQSTYFLSKLFCFTTEILSLQLNEFLVAMSKRFLPQMTLQVHKKGRKDLIEKGCLTR